MRTFHGIHGRAFPNCFFLGFTQTGYSPNFTHTLSEQADHVGHILGVMRERGIRTVEASQEAEDGWVQMIRGNRNPSQLRFLRECTPSYTNGEGKPDDENRFVAGRFPGGPIAFFAILREWREAGDLAGLELDRRANRIARNSIPTRDQ